METAFSSGLSSDLAAGADTIVARATPAGRGGLAVIRVSGSRSAAIAEAVCPELKVAAAWRASLVELRSTDGELIDRGIAIPYRSPRSFTGEDMLEIMVHGSPWVVEQTIAAAVAAGARPAGPGEFTRRAVANGKIDLVQAEAVNDLVAAETAWQARLARTQAEGALSERFASLREQMVGLLAELESALDFSEHDIPYERERATEIRDRCIDLARALLDTAPAGRRIRDGARVVIVGPPNAGKSTFFNRLVGNERAIVSPHPGTTRDVVEAEIELAGIPVVLQDTAGLTTTADPVENEGVRRARGAAAEADVVVTLWPVDEASPAHQEVAGSKVIKVRSKWDLAAAAEAEEGWIAVSCETGQGLGAVAWALAAEVGFEIADLGGEVAISERHEKALERAVDELEGARMETPELAAEAVRCAVAAVEELIGEVVAEDVLDRVFSAFCIGK
jgi:tRNA modification GTPase